MRWRQWVFPSPSVLGEGAPQGRMRAVGEAHRSPGRNAECRGRKRRKLRVPRRLAVRACRNDHETKWPGRGARPSAEPAPSAVNRLLRKRCSGRTFADGGSRASSSCDRHPSDPMPRTSCAAGQGSSSRSTAPRTRPTRRWRTTQGVLSSCRPTAIASCGSAMMTSTAASRTSSRRSLRPWKAASSRSAPLRGAALIRPSGTFSRRSAGEGTRCGSGASHGKAETLANASQRTSRNLRLNSALNASFTAPAFQSPIVSLSGVGVSWASICSPGRRMRRG